MFCAYTRPRYQVSVYRTIGPLVYKLLPFLNPWVGGIGGGGDLQYTPVGSYHPSIIFNF